MLLSNLILGKSVTSLCWRPDGKAIAVGLEDGTITLHDVEVSRIARALISNLCIDLKLYITKLA